MKAYGAIEVQYHAFLTSALCVDNNHSHAPLALPLKEVQLQQQSVWQAQTVAHNFIPLPRI